MKNSRHFKFVRIYLTGFILWSVSFLASLKFGVANDLDWDWIVQLRLPRAVLASAVGMGLSVSGVTLQALFSNPLCEPSTIGISSGAALGAVLGSALGSTFIYSGLMGSSFLGALFFAFILYLASSRFKAENASLLLIGVMLGFMGSSLVALWMALSDVSGIQGALFWLLGDLSRITLTGAIFTFILSLFISGFLWSRWSELDPLLLGEQQAASLGVPIRQVRARLLVLSSLLIALCVSASGMIGFIGLIVPHLGRKLVGALHYHLIPVSALFGAFILTAADLLARLIVQPQEIPVGVVSALIGAPFFAWIILSRRRFQ